MSALERGIELRSAAAAAATHDVRTVDVMGASASVAAILFAAICKMHLGEVNVFRTLMW